MSSSGTVLITGATGAQGGTLARRLLAAGRPVRALVRDPSAPAAEDLAALGAELAAGDLDDPASLRTAAAGVHGVFGVLPNYLPSPDPEAELRQGRNLVDAVAAAGVAHLVYSSVGGAERSSGVMHFETKAEIEAYIEAAGVPATVLRPVFFMENWHFMVPEAHNGERIGRLPLDPDTPVQMIAVEDIARIAADAFDRPADHLGSRLEIAADELTVRQIAEAHTRVDGVPTRFERQPLEQVRSASEDLANMFDWIGRSGFRADLAALRARYPELLTLEAWLTRNSRRSTAQSVTAAR